jgi:hypothetical protein
LNDIIATFKLDDDATSNDLVKRMGKPQRATEPKTREEAAPALNQQQTAAYIADVSLGLRGMADKADLTFLTYLLDMAVHEAMQQSELPRRRRTDPK